jgi:uncharacterized protein
MDEQILPPPIHACRQCGNGMIPSSRFCTVCGAAFDPPPPPIAAKRDLDRFFWAMGLIGSYIISSYLIDEWADYRRVLAFDVGFLLLVVIMGIALRRDLIGALRVRVPQVQRLFTYAILQAALTWFVFRSMPYIVDRFDLEERSYSALFLDSPHPLLLSILSIAVFPALTEELAFRGILFGQLQRLTTGTSAVVVTAILFAFVHFAVLGLYWLLPCGLLYGWIRHREGHIWWGVLLHACHNSLVVLQEFGHVS